jgi:hypothetical protein
MSTTILLLVYYKINCYAWQKKIVMHFRINLIYKEIQSNQIIILFVTYVKLTILTISIYFFRPTILILILLYNTYIKAYKSWWSGRSVDTCTPCKHTQKKVYNIFIMVFLHKFYFLLEINQIKCVCKNLHIAKYYYSNLWD